MTEKLESFHQLQILTDQLAASTLQLEDYQRINPHKIPLNSLEHKEEKEGKGHLSSHSSTSAAELLSTLGLHNSSSSTANHSLNGQRGAGAHHLEEAPNRTEDKDNILIQSSPPGCSIM